LRHFGIGNKKELQQKRCRELEEDLLLEYWSSIELVEFSLLLSCSYTLSLLHLEAIQPVLEKKREREECTSSELLWVVVVGVVFSFFFFFWVADCSCA
jgi:hypothetical protein